MDEEYFTFFSVLETVERNHRREIALLFWEDP